MNRRDTVLALVSLSTVPHIAEAQQARKLPVVGFLHPGAAYESPAMKGLLQGLLDAGHIEGKAFRIEARWGEGKLDALPRLARELAAAKVDLIVAVGSPAVRAAKASVGALPIVAADLETDPVASALAANFARPGGTVTGLFLDQPGLAGKWLQLVREVVSDVRRIAVLWDATTGGHQLRAMTEAAKKVSLDVHVLELSEAATLESVLAAGLKHRPQALIQLSSPLVNPLAKRIAAFSAANRLPGISPFRAFPESGGLMSYGPILSSFFRRLAPYVSQILKGAQAGNLPIEQPTHFELIINQKAARALDIKVPQSVLLAADLVLE